ncbi:MAG TPA: uracil-DNA glycosylase [Nitrospirales bacterium]|nr:uracil-DNA glycosylase [Nitrospirales bacterium]HIN34060.1 uracil-DNA glycosylase [Nitrospirales bacterium]
MTLDELGASLRDCQRCRLASKRTQVVFGIGNPNASILFIGEAPGFHEDKQGEPFVGAAGKLLTELLESAGLSRNDVYIANVIKCRPPDNRDPMPDEIETCKPFLMQQIELINPRVICTLGNFAIRTMLGKQVSITKIRGQQFEVQGFHVFPMLHPAAALHQGSFRALIQEDFQKLKIFLDNLPRPTSKSAEQMGLFG